MGVGSLFLFLALLVLVALFVARPLFAQPDSHASLDSDSSSTEAEYERVLDALQELDADWQLSKIPEEAYRSQRAQLVAKGAAALKELEKAGVVSKGAAENALRTSPQGEPSDAQLEALIARRAKSRRK